MRARVLVLGAGGMLGSQVLKHLSGVSNLEVHGTYRNQQAKGICFEAENFIKSPDGFKFVLDYDYIINCVGVIKPFCKDSDLIGVQRAILINGMMPRVLAEQLRGRSTRVIQIATDCVYSGSEGFYDERSPHDPLDIYGKSKSLGEVNHPQFLHIRCSIVGREVKSKVSLLEWFLNQPEGATIQGFEHHLWNGVTTLQFAEVCEEIITKIAFDSIRAQAPVHHFTPNEVVTKAQLLAIFKDVFNKDIKINRVNRQEDFINRTISTRYKALSEIYPATFIKEQIRRLADEL